MSDSKEISTIHYDKNIKGKEKKNNRDAYKFVLKKESNYLKQIYLGFADKDKLFNQIELIVRFDVVGNEKKKAEAVYYKKDKDKDKGKDTQIKTKIIKTLSNIEILKEEMKEQDSDLYKILKHRGAFDFFANYLFSIFL